MPLRDHPNRVTMNPKLYGNWLRELYYPVQCKFLPQVFTNHFSMLAGLLKACYVWEVRDCLNTQTLLWSPAPALAICNERKLYLDDLPTPSATPLPWLVCWSGIRPQAEGEEQMDTCHPKPAVAARMDTDQQILICSLLFSVWVHYRNCLNFQLLGLPMLPKYHDCMLLYWYMQTETSAGACKSNISTDVYECMMDEECM